MIISIATALFGHHGAALITSIYYVIFSCLEPVYLCILHASLYGYFGTVVIFLFAAEAAYTYAKIIRAVEDIENYVLKASLVAWSKWCELDSLVRTKSKTKSRRVCNSHMKGQLAKDDVMT